ncbi:hypothetical protein C8R46DRAFT_1038713 [Mycena filopes]|nr:hypothetical protein C8R46DRAFT_1038713 [Mycena filopes]
MSSSQYQPSYTPTGKQRRSPYERYASPPPTYSGSPSPPAGYSSIQHTSDMQRYPAGTHVYAPQYSEQTQYAPYDHPLPAAAVAPAIPVTFTDDARTKLNERVRRRCFNCCTTDTATWRRSNLSPGKVLCNKCGLFERTHSRPRPAQFPPKRGPQRAVALPPHWHRDSHAYQPYPRPSVHSLPSSEATPQSTSHVVQNSSAPNGPGYNNATSPNPTSRVNGAPYPKDSDSLRAASRAASSQGEGNA